MQCENDTFVEEINVLNEKIKALEHVTSSKDKTSKKTSGKVRNKSIEIKLSERHCHFWNFWYLSLAKLQTVSE